jgi:hypothetical protein
MQNNPLHTENRVYDIFEVYADGTMRWRTAVIGTNKAESTLQELARATPNKLMVLSLTDSKIPIMQIQPGDVRDTP